MTSKELAEKLTPFVRDAVARSKEEILADLPKFQRAWAWMLWPTLLGIGVPMNTRVNIEFALYMYHKYAERYLGPLVDAWISLNKDSPDPTVKEITEYLTILKQPTEEFLMVVQDVMAARVDVGSGELG